MILPDANALNGDWITWKNLKNGDVLVFADAGLERDSKFNYPDDHKIEQLRGKPKKEYVFTVTFKGEKKLLRVNWSSMKTCQMAFGGNTNDWVGKSVSVGISPTADGKNKQVSLSPIEENEWK